MGGKPFYLHAEADEVDGIESTVDSWTASLWVPLKAAVLNKPVAPEPGKLLRSCDVKQTEEGEANGESVALVGEELIAALRGAGEGKELDGVPGLAECRLKAVIDSGEEAE